MNFQILNCFYVSLGLNNISCIECINYCFREKEVKIGLPDLVWTHFAIVYDSSGMNVFVNESLVSPSRKDDDSKTVLIPEESVLFFGKLDSADSARGNFDFDELLIFPFALEDDNLIFFQS